MADEVLDPCISGILQWVEGQSPLSTEEHLMVRCSRDQIEETFIFTGWFPMSPILRHLTTS